ncbi:hypothetical protein FGG08_007193 [Glutinoglossum americanum]|uniref:Ribosomal protein S21 n=1 Tax=Glutinoglossum americanum TaxID=1670608 RepID=A0A9P8I3V1_9PEZI|nr:hypothetical protein FGG08_007193 [Glutinoglossum americanum]
MLNLPPEPQRDPSTFSDSKPPNSASDIASYYRDYGTSRRVPTDRMLPPRSGSLLTSSDFLQNNTSLDELPPRPPAQPTIRLSPSTGRTVAVEPRRGVDLARAFRNLDMMCRQNNVKQDFARQRFHERPGLKRKRLKSVRWRRNFMAGFREMVGKVDRMRRKGW